LTEEVDVPETNSGGTGEMTCIPVAREEHHEKTPALFVGNKPNGKSQFNCNTRSKMPGRVSTLTRSQIWPKETAVRKRKSRRRKKSGLRPSRQAAEGKPRNFIRGLKGTDVPLTKNLKQQSVAHQDEAIGQNNECSN
jgi:hypothetical protein